MSSHPKKNIRPFDMVYLGGVLVLLLHMAIIARTRLDTHQLLVEKKQALTADFVWFYKAGQLALNPATRQHIYDPDVQMNWQAKFFAPLGIRPDKVFYTQVVPFVFPLMAPFALLPAEQAFIAWAICSSIAGLLGFLFLNASLPRGATRLAIFAAGAFVSWPFLGNLITGQFGLVLFMLICAYWWALERKHDIAGGIALALASFRPHYVLFFALPAFAQKRWRLLAAACCMELLLLCLAGMTVGWSNLFNYPAILMNAETTPNFIGVQAGIQVCLRGLISQFLPAGQALRLSLSFTLSGLFAVLFLWRKAAGSRRVDAANWAYALTIMICLAASPHTHSHDLTLLAAAAWLTLPSLSFFQLSQLKEVSERIWCLILFLYPPLSRFVFSGAYMGGVWPYPQLTLLGLNLIALCAGLIHFRFLLKPGQDAPAAV